MATRIAVKEFSVSNLLAHPPHVLRIYFVIPGADHQCGDFYLFQSATDIPGFQAYNPEFAGTACQEQYLDFGVVTDAFGPRNDKR